ncbi:MAG: hypothetical protein AAF226_09845 [Verrucomicrobiota bacterium]
MLVLLFPVIKGNFPKVRYPHWEPFDEARYRVYGDIESLSLEPMSFTDEPIGEVMEAVFAHINEHTEEKWSYEFHPEIDTTIQVNWVPNSRNYWYLFHQLRGMECYPLKNRHLVFTPTNPEKPSHLHYFEFRGLPIRTTERRTDVKDFFCLHASGNFGPHESCIFDSETMTLKGVASAANLSKMELIVTGHYWEPSLLTEKIKYWLAIATEHYSPIHPYPKHMLSPADPFSQEPNTIEHTPSGDDPFGSGPSPFD